MYIYVYRLLYIYIYIIYCHISTYVYIYMYNTFVALPMAVQQQQQQLESHYRNTRLPFEAIDHTLKILEDPWSCICIRATKRTSHDFAVQFDIRRGAPDGSHNKMCVAGCISTPSCYGKFQAVMCSGALLQVVMLGSGNLIALQRWKWNCAPKILAGTHCPGLSLSRFEYRRRFVSKRVPGCHSCEFSGVSSLVFVILEAKLLAAWRQGSSELKQRDIATGVGKRTTVLYE